jgi:Na+-transporting methylmalonyl-CoA/oxaloacetate decarboxylase gamma subunit
MNLSGIASLAASADLTLAEKGIASAKVVLTGFVVVFSMLILLILIIKVYSAIVSKAQQVGKTKKEKVTDVASATPAPAAKAASPAPVAQTAQGQIDDEVVAVISAAVATMYASPEKVRIKSIKKSNGGRNAWANAGLLNNTRPF